MPAERAGYTVTMFLIDVSPTMAKTRVVEAQDGLSRETKSVEMTNLEWSLQFVLLKVQEMIFHGRKTEQCGVILFGTEETDNIINEADGGYDHVTEYIPISQPNVNTLTKLQQLQPATVSGDPLDAIIVGIQTQDKYLRTKKTWTRKMVLLTDGECPIVLEDWKLTARKMKSLSIITTIVGIDFDEGEIDFKEEDKSDVKRMNEDFYKSFVAELGDLGLMGTCAYALQECVRPEVKVTKSALMGTVLRLGDNDVRPDESIEINVKASKCTAHVRPPTMKKFAKRVLDRENEALSQPKSQFESQKSVEDGDAGGKRDVYAQLVMQTDYFIDQHSDIESDKNEIQDEMDVDNEDIEKADKAKGERIEKDTLIRGFKYGATYVPCPDGQFPRLNTQPGMDICGFFPLSKLRRDFAMGEVQYIWADQSSGRQQITFSSMARAMLNRKVAAIVRWVSREGMDPKMGVLIPREFDEVDCFLWIRMPFADDVRKYTFPSFNHLVSKKGETITEHPFLPTDEQLGAMDSFVDAMDLTQAGDKDENGERMPWFDPRLAFNPAVHRIKQALFHAAIVTNLLAKPVPPPHPEVVKYLEPPRRVLKRAHGSLEEARQAFKIKQVPRRVVRARKDEHVRAENDDEELLLLDQPHVKNPARKASQQDLTPSAPSYIKKAEDDSDTEPESDEAVDRRRPGEAMVISNPASDSSGSIAPLSPTSATDLHDDEEDDGPATKSEPRRIIHVSQPLSDFKKNIKEGDLVSKAVEDLAWAIKEILNKPFASRRHTELINCMRELRSTCLNEDEVDAWNSFLEELKSTCLSEFGPNNKPFWTIVQASGREMSLISTDEASKLGGTSTVSESDSIKFINS